MITSDTTVDPCPHVCTRCGGCPDCCPCTTGDLLDDALRTPRTP